MEFWELVAFTLRIAAPILAFIILSVCFWSLNDGRRTDHALVVLQDDNTGKIYPVTFWENLIGRSDKADICVENDMTISREHAVLLRRDTGWFVTDIGSKAGVYVNEKKIKGRCMVYIGDKISLGNTSLILRRVDETKESSRTRVSGAAIKKSVSGTFLLALITFYIIMITTEAMIYVKDVLYLIPVSLFVVVMWVFHKFSNRFMKIKHFELEAIAFLLTGTGIVMCNTYSNHLGYMQLIATIIGLCIFSFIVWFIKVPDRVIYWRLIMSVFAILMLGAAAIFGREVNGASNWVFIGPFSFQPSEFAKVAYIFIGAGTLDQLQKLQNLLGFIIVTAICILILGYISDFGSALIFFAAFIIISYLRSGDMRKIMTIGAVAIIGAFFILTLKPYVAERFQVIGHIWEYSDSLGYQQTNTLVCSASGGLFGLGTGNGNLRYVMASESDLVFGAISEEMGLISALMLAVTIGGFMIYARAVIIKSRSVFYSMAACSAGGLLVFQAALHIFGILGMLPLTGVTLPFVSYGGSSMMACWGLLAFIKSADERTYYKKSTAEIPKKGEVLI